MSNKQFGISGKGYYIALILSAAAIGITGYLYYQNANRVQEVSLQEEIVQQVAATTPSTASAPSNQAASTSPSEADIQPSESTAQHPAAKLRTASPVSGEMVNGYAMDCLSYNETTRDWRVHNGIDLAAEEGSPVTAAADGTVVKVFEDDALGCTVVLRHTGGYTTEYANLSEEVCVSPGDTVKLGDKIGYVGCTALVETAMDSHVHFCVSFQDAPVSPEEFLAMN